MNLTAFGFPVLTFRLLVPYSGPWMLDAVLDADVAPTSGAPAVVAGESAQLVGTVDADPDRTFKFGERVRLGVLAGGGGWHKPVRPQHYHSDAALPLATVVTSTAAEVKEKVVVSAPETLGKDFFRVAGPASQVLRGRSWWVDFLGVTQVGPRLPKPAPTSLEILSWDEVTGTCECALDELLEPGTVLVDERFGTRIVRDVELVLSESSIRATCWLVSSAPEGEGNLELVQALGAIATRAIGPQWLRQYEYTVVSMQGDRVAVTPADPKKAPQASPLSVWCGAPGMKSKLAPGTKVLVGFANGDPLSPFIGHFEPAEGEGWMPLELTLDALKKVEIGPSALAVELAGGSAAVALAPALITWAGQVVAQCAANTPPITIPPLGANVAAVKVKAT